MAQEWAQSLKAARERLGLSRSELARRTSLSVETIRAYEVGRRKPSRRGLDAVLGALRLERLEANRLRHALGYSADYLRLGLLEPTYMFSLEELHQWVENNPWPQFVVDENTQVVVANSVVQKLWGVDLEREFLAPIERNLLSFATDPRFAERALNWDEMVAHAVAIWKGHHLGRESLERPTPFFEQALSELAKGDPDYVRRFLEVWERTPGKTPKVRDRYRVVWSDPVCGEMRFLALSSTANEGEGLAFNDWIPVDAATWQALDAFVQRE